MTKVTTVLVLCLVVISTVLPATAFADSKVYLPLVEREPDRFVRFQIFKDLNHDGIYQLEEAPYSPLEAYQFVAVVTVKRASDDKVLATMFADEFGETKYVLLNVATAYIIDYTWYRSLPYSGDVPECYIGTRYLLLFQQAGNISTIQLPGEAACQH